MFIDYLQPNAEQIESGGKRPSIFTNACAINYKANSLFESRLNNTIIHNIQVTGQKQTLPVALNGWDKSAEGDWMFSTKQMQEMKSIHLAKLQQECGTL